MNHFKKKLAFLLCLILALTCGTFYPQQASQGNAASSAKLSRKSGTTGIKEVFYISVKNFKKDASYSISPNKKGYIRLNRIDAFDTYLTISGNALKKGTVKITVKETRKNKTKKIGTYTLTIGNQTATAWTSYNEISAPAGKTFSLKAVGAINQYSTANPAFSSSDKSVATVNSKGLVTTRKTGITVIKVKNSKQDFVQEITLNVVKKAVSSKTASLDRSIKNLITKKITKKNIKSVYNTYVDVQKKVKKAKLISANGYVNYPLKYAITDAHANLENFFMKNCTYNHSGVSLDVLQLTGVSASKLKVKLNKKVSAIEVMAQLFNDGAAKKYSSSTKVTIPFIVSNGSFKMTYYYTGNVKTGQKSISAKYITYGTSKVKKGSNYYYGLLNTSKNKMTWKSKSIKAK